MDKKRKMSLPITSFDNADEHVADVAAFLGSKFEGTKYQLQKIAFLQSLKYGIDAKKQNFISRSIARCGYVLLYKCCQHVVALNKLVVIESNKFLHGGMAYRCIRCALSTLH